MNGLLPSLHQAILRRDADRILECRTNAWDGTMDRSASATPIVSPDISLGVKLSGWWGRYGEQAAAESGTADVIGTLFATSRFVELGRASHSHNDDMVAAGVPEYLSYGPRTAVRIEQSSSMASVATNASSPISKFFDTDHGACFVLFSPRIASATAVAPNEYDNHPAIDDSNQFMGVYFSTTKLYAYAWDSAAKSVSWDVTTDYALNTAIAVMVRWDGAAGKLYGRLNLGARKERSFGAALGGVAGTLRCGRNPRTGSYRCDVLEVITVDGTNGVITEAQEEAVMRYLVSRGSQLTVP